MTDSIDWPDDVPGDWSFEQIEHGEEPYDLGYRVVAGDGTAIAQHIDEPLAELLVRTEQAINDKDGLTDELRRRWQTVQGSWDVHEASNGYDVKYETQWDDLGKAMTVVIAQSVSRSVAEHLCRLQSSLG